MYYYRARYYSPEHGRFIQPDPIGYADGMNMYAYVSNDPLNFYDPLGLSQRYHINHQSLTSLYTVDGYNDMATIIDISSLAFDDELRDILGYETFNEFRSVLNVGFDIILDRRTLASSASYAGVYTGGFIKGLIGSIDNAVTSSRLWRRGGDDVSNGGSVGAMKLVSFGKNATVKFKKHSQHIRETARKMDIEIPKGPSKPETRLAMEEFITNVVAEGNTRVGPYMTLGDVQWSKLGDAVVVRKMDGEFVTFLDATKGGVMGMAPKGL